MLKQGTVDALRKGELSRQDGYIVIAMCFYPRGLRKDLRDEYRGDLAPDRQLFKEWQYFLRKIGHDPAFEKISYEERFKVGEGAQERLKELSEMSHDKDIYIVCQCNIGDRCHREMVMMTASKKYGASIDKVFNEYPAFERRLSEGKEAT